MIPIVHHYDLPLVDGRLDDFERPLEIWVDRGLREVTRRPLRRALKRWLTGRGLWRKICLLAEPDAITGLKADILAGGWRRFHHVLTFDEDILRAVPNATLMYWGTSWIRDWPAARPKRFEVSFLCGHKTQTEGHRLRHDIWRRRGELGVPTRLYLSRHGGPPGATSELTLGESKEPLFDSQFHIAIENCRIRHYFSEKLVDCFRTKTVPVYWGCVNIGEIFNPAGIVQVTSADELIAAVNGLGPKRYEAMREAIEDNYRRSERFVDYALMLNEKLMDLGYRRRQHRGSSQQSAVSG